ncbi:MAG: methyl-accepting chemotaxis protein [Alphaproteobacteria bacterium]|nr:MAG: methyl-accepting chemotaxis protein [Alphaproteobacteria bacterium]
MNIVSYVDNFSKDFSIAKRVFGGFAVVLALLIVLGSVSGTNLVSGKSSFDRYREIARQANQAARIQANMLSTRIATKDFLIKASDTSIETARSRAQRTFDMNEELKAMVSDPDQIAIVEQTHRELTLYLKTFDQVISIERGKNAMVADDLDRLGPQMASQLSALAEQAAAAQDMAHVRATNALLHQITMLRFHANKYLVASDEAAFAHALEMSKAAEQGFANLSKGGALPAGFADVARAHKQYEDTLVRIKAAIEKRNALVHETMDVIGPKVSDDLEAMKLAIKQEQDTIGPATADSLSMAVMITLIVATASILVGCGAAYVIGAGISRPVTGLTSDLQALAEGNLNRDINGVNRKDEIGRMAGGLEVFKQKLLENRRLEALDKQRQEEERERQRQAEEARIAAEKQAEANRAAEREREARKDALIKSFGEAVSGVLSTLALAGKELKETATAMSATAEETGRQSATVAAAANQTSANVQAVATSAEELTASIQEISRQVSKSSSMAQSAVQEGRTADEGMAALSDTAARVGNVVQLINDIAEQTNLLALNATIEAARAGDAGRGFAVVATEVKALAQQTAKATEEISSQIEEIQSQTERAVQSIGGINRTITTMNEISSMIAAAVEEQGAATGEIAQTVQQTAAGTDAVTQNINGVSEAAQMTGAASSQVLSAADRLNEQSEQMRVAVSSFLNEIRSF